ncbi:phospholipase A2 [Elgaria multicarinata webbii]|uniref:phospholipase A2 n=1 Tax=Elgaria multicarinata webbii TaxID=159646 RepID=UPI002FCD4001
MNLLFFLLLASANAAMSRNLWQFRKMIKCTIPGSDPLKDYNNYGCYCGFGGSGTPVDDLDRCCETHDNCYSAAKKHPKCKLILDNPYTKTYYYNCSGTEVTCEEKNDECQAFVCNCDRSAAICFAGAPYNKEYKNLNTSKCCQ